MSEVNESTAFRIADVVNNRINEQLKSRHDAMDEMKLQLHGIMKEVSKLSSNVKLQQKAALQQSDIDSRLKEPDVHTKSKIQSVNRTQHYVDHNNQESCSLHKKQTFAFAKNLPRVASIKEKSPAKNESLKLAADALKIKYPQCKTIVYPPSSWNSESLVDPTTHAKLQLEFIYGAEKQSNTSGLFLLSDEYIWYCAAIVVIYNAKENTQRFFTGHNTPISSLALHPNSTIVASSEVANHRQDQSNCKVIVWDSSMRIHDNQFSEDIVNFPISGRSINSIGFSHDGKMIVGVLDSMKICVYEWQKKNLLVCIKGYSSRIESVAFNPFQAIGIPDASGPVPGQALTEDDACYTIVSVGMNHIRFWVLSKVNFSGQTTSEKEKSAFIGSSFGSPKRIRADTPREKVWKLIGNSPAMMGKGEIQDFTCLAFINDSPELQVYDDNSQKLLKFSNEFDHTKGRIVAGTSQGDLYIFSQPMKKFKQNGFKNKFCKYPEKWWELPDSIEDKNLDLNSKLKYEANAKLNAIIPCSINVGNKFKISKACLAEVEDIQLRLKSKPQSKTLRSRLKELQYTGVLGHHGSILSISYNEIKNQLITSGIDKNICFWDILENSSLEKTTSIQLSHPAYCLSVSSHNHDLMTLSDATGSILSVNLSTLERDFVSRSYESGVKYCFPHPSEEIVFSIGMDGYLREWCLQSKKETNPNKIYKLTEQCIAGACHPQAKDVALLLRNNEIIIVDYLKFQFLHSKAMPLTQNSVQSDWNGVIKYSPDGYYLVATSKDRKLHLFDTKLGYRRLNSCETYSSALISLDWSKNNYNIQSNSSDGDILYWIIKDNAIKQISDLFSMRDVVWNSWSCCFGWPVQGLRFVRDTYNQEITCTQKSNERVYNSNETLVNAYGKDIHVFKWPCLQNYPPAIYKGHSSLIRTLNFSFDNAYVISTAIDGTFFQWKFSSSCEKSSPKGKPDDHSEKLLPQPCQPIGCKMEELEALGKDHLQTSDDTCAMAPTTPIPPVSENSSLTDRRCPSPRAQNINKSNASRTLREGKKEQMLECQALYDFTGEDNEELDIFEDEILVVIRQQHEWFFGENKYGERGLFPMNYVKLLN